MKKWLLVSLLMVVGLITGCGLHFPTGQGQYYRVELTPAEWGFQVDSSGTITIVGNSAVVLSAPGAPAAVLQSAEVTYVKGDGQLVFANEPGSSFNIHVSIPEGIVCPEDTASCTKETEGWAYGWAKSEAFNFSMEGKVAEEYLRELNNNNPVLGWNAHVVFHAVTTTGKPISWEQDIHIVFPLSSG